MWNLKRKFLFFAVVLISISAVFFVFIKTGDSILPAPENSKLRLDLDSSPGKSSLDQGPLFQAPSSTPPDPSISKGKGGNGGEVVEPLGVAPQTMDQRGIPADLVYRSVKTHAHPGAAKIGEALRTGEHPERFSSLFLPPKPFDKDAYLRDPKAYLDIVEPGRVFQIADPGPRVSPLQREGSGLHQLKPGQTCILGVRCSPEAPVSFLSTHMGFFKENGLNAITVPSDEEGVARVTFVAGPGVSGECLVLAGSPVASGQVQFKVSVEEAGILPGIEGKLRKNK